MEFDKDKLQEVLRIRQERRDYIDSIDDGKTLPYNDRINNILDKLGRDVDSLLYETKEIGYIYDDPYNSNFSTAFKEIYEHLSKFMFSFDENEKIMIFKRNDYLYELSIIHGQGSELYISLIQNEDEYIDNLISKNNEKIKDIEYEIELLDALIPKLVERENLFKYMKNL